MTLLVRFRKVVLSCHLVFRMYLMNVCSVQVVVLVTLHVSESYSSTLNFQFGVEDSDLVSC